MPTGATPVFSHGQSRENNSWASAPAPNPRLPRRKRRRGAGRGEQEEGRDFRGRTVPATRPASQYRHKFVLKVEKPEKEWAACFSVQVWLVKQMGDAAQRFLFLAVTPSLKELIILRFRPGALVHSFASLFTVSFILVILELLYEIPDTN